MNFFIRRPQPTEWKMCKDSTGHARFTFYGLSRDQWVFNLACDAPIFTFIGFYIFLSFFWQYNRAIHVLGGRFDETDQMVWLALVCGACFAVVFFVMPGLVWAVIIVYATLNVWLDSTLKHAVSREDNCVDPVCFWVRWGVVVALTLLTVPIMACLCSCLSDLLTKIHRSLAVGYSLSLSAALQVDGIDDHFSEGWTRTAIVFGILIVVIAMVKFVYDKWALDIIHNAWGDNSTKTAKYIRWACFPCFCSYKFDQERRRRQRLEQERERERERGDSERDPILEKDQFEI